MEKKPSKCLILEYKTGDKTYNPLSDNYSKIIAVSSIIVILSLVGCPVMAEEKSCSSFFSSLGMLQSSPGRSCAEIYQINKASQGMSGLYWINTTSDLHQVTCDMELEYMWWTQRRLD